MRDVIDARRGEIEALCRRFRVERLELFGSALDVEFDPDTSDLDFVVDLQDMASADYADAYFGLLEELEALFQRPVDLVMLSAVRNPYLRESIERSRLLLYAA